MRTTETYNNVFGEAGMFLAELERRRPTALLRQWLPRRKNIIAKSIAPIKKNHIAATKLTTGLTASPLISYPPENLREIRLTGDRSEYTEKQHIPEKSTKGGDREYYPQDDGIVLIHFR